MKKVGNFRAPFRRQVKPRRRTKVGEGPACIHAQAERGRFSGALKRGEFLDAFDGALAAFEAFAIESRIRPVFCSSAEDVTSGAGAEAVIRAATPVVDVVETRVSGLRVEG